MDHHGLDSSRLLQELQSPDIDTVRGAAFQAGDIHLREAIPLLCGKISSEHIGVQEAAEYALRRIRGKEAIEALLPLLRSDDAPVRNVTMDILREIGSEGVEIMQPFLRDDDPDVRIFVADILGHCKRHRAALLLSETLLKDPEVNVRYQAAVSLGMLGFPESVPVLAQAMHDEEWVQFAVVEALAKIKERSAVNALLQLLPSCSDLVSSAIVDALAGLGDVKVIPLLTKHLESVSVAMRHKIVRAIVGIITVPALPLMQEKIKERLRFYLQEALTDNDEEILTAALQGLGAIGHEEASAAIMDLAVTIDPDRQPDLFASCIDALGSIGFNDCLQQVLQGEDIPRIALVLYASRHFTDRRAMECLKDVFWRVGMELQRAAIANAVHLATCEDLPFFVAVMGKSSDPEILKSALVFFGNQQGCEEAEELAFDALDHRYDDVKEMALEACINLHSPMLNERFKERFAGDDPMQRLMAVYALGRYGVEENGREIDAALGDADPRVRQAAVEVFMSLGARAEEHFPRLLPLLEDPDRNVRLALVDLLGQVGVPSVVPPLVKALEDPDEWVRMRAIEAIGIYRCADQVPTLAQMLETASPMIALKIIEALGRIGNHVAFSVLFGLVSHEDREIQIAATEALEAIQARQE
jgi:HEAT repeat protein